MIFTAIPAQLNSNASLAVTDANGQKLNSGDTVAYGSTGFSITAIRESSRRGKYRAATMLVM